MVKNDQEWKRGLSKRDTCPVGVLIGLLPSPAHRIFLSRGRSSGRPRGQAPGAVSAGQ